MLGVDKAIKWKSKGDSVQVDLKNIGVNDLPCDFIYTFKITECGE